MSDSSHEDDRGDGAFVESLRTGIGAPGAVRCARDEVNQPMIRHWCDVMTDHNPIYTDPEFAAQSVHGGIVAPPAMLDTWMMTGLAPRVPDEAADDARSWARPLERLDAAGFTSVVATNTSHEYVRYLRPGDRIRARQSLAHVSDEKKTALGVGHFLTTETEFIDQDDACVGRVRFTILKYEPGTGSVSASGDGQPASMPRPRPAISRDTRFFWDGIDQGELRIQQCNACQALHHPPMVRCRDCGGYDLGWTVSRGRGHVYSFCEVHHPQYPIFDYPVLAVLVELEEGVRMMSNLVGVTGDEIRIGMPVEVTIEATDPELNLPLFRPVRPERREATLCFEDVEVGDALAPCPVPVTPTLIVGGAMASRDFQDVHHDVQLAKKRGSPDIFMNIMTSGGLTSRYVTDWAGPEALLRGMEIRLGVPNYPGDTMTLRGGIEAAEVRDGRGIVEVAVRGTNRLGDHVVGRVELELPRRAP